MDLLIIFGPSLAFLGMYVGKHGASANAILPHLWVVTILWIGIYSLRYWLKLGARAVGNLEAFTDWLSAAMVTLTLLLICLYYLTVLEGLASWGKVISSSLILAYAGQAPSLAQDVLGMNIGWLVVALIFVAACLTTSMRLIYKKYDSLEYINRLKSPIIKNMLVVSVSLGCLIFFVHLILYPDNASREPVALTLAPEGTVLQSEYVANSPRLQESEDLIRKTYKPVQLDKKPNIVLIIVDALRAANLPAYGYARPTTPWLTYLQAAGQLIAIPNTYAVCGESSCGIRAIMSSRYTHQFVPRPITLPEVLRLHGYRTAYFLGGDHTNFYDMKSAYGAADFYFDGSMQKSNFNDDNIVLRQLNEYLEIHPAPTYFHFHLMSAHPLGVRSSEASPFEPSKSYVLAAAKEWTLSSSLRNRAKYINYYDNGIFRADYIIRKIFDILGKSGYLDEALIIVAADHGELVGEDGLYGHSKSLSDAVLRIPFLIINRLGKQNILVDDLAYYSQVDIAPTVLHAIGAPVPKNWSGNAIQNAATNEKSSRRPIFFQQSRQFGLIDSGARGVAWRYSVLLDGREQAQSVGSTFAPVPTAAQRAAWRRELLDLEVSANEAGGRTR